MHGVVPPDDVVNKEEGGHVYWLPFEDFDRPDETPPVLMAGKLRGGKDRHSLRGAHGPLALC